MRQENGCATSLDSVTDYSDMIPDHKNKAKSSAGPALCLDLIAPPLGVGNSYFDLMRSGNPRGRLCTYLGVFNANRSTSITGGTCE